MKNNHSLRLQKGFSLIELLVVMVIIAILAALSLFALQGARESGRNAQRKGDIETIRSALEIYKADCNQYPASLPSAGSSLTANCPNAVTYLEEVPSDPIAGRRYSYNPSGSPQSSYTLCAALEGEGGAVAGCGSCGSGTCTYAKSNP